MLGNTTRQGSVGYMKSEQEKTSSQCNSHGLSVKSPGSPTFARVLMCIIPGLHVAK